MWKRIGYVLLAIVLLFAGLSWYGVRKFNDSWFKDKPNYFSFTQETKPIHFQWSADTIFRENPNEAATQPAVKYIEPHAAIIIPVRVEGSPQRFGLQFDTGAPTTLLYGNTLEALQKQGHNIAKALIEGQAYVTALRFSLGGNNIEAEQMYILPKYGNGFAAEDSLKTIILGTLGADFLDGHTTVIDFASQCIQVYEKRPMELSSAAEFQPFNFAGRRLMLPATINGKERQLFYDSGCSAFGLITTKKRFEKYTDENEPEIQYDANRFGEAIPIHHKNTEQVMLIADTELSLGRVSYVDMYAKYQGLLTPFTRIGGWLGNKPFIGNTLIVDTKAQQFAVWRGALLKDE